jgi:hypothetical protein
LQLQQDVAETVADLGAFIVENRESVAAQKRYAGQNHKSEFPHP